MVVTGSPYVFRERTPAAELELDWICELRQEAFILTWKRKDQCLKLGSGGGESEKEINQEAIQKLKWELRNNPEGIT